MRLSIDYMSSDDCRSKAKLDQVKEIGGANVEFTKNLQPTLARLQFFSEIEAAWRLCSSE